MKTTNFVILTILACGLAMATDVVNLATQSHSPPITVGNTMGVTVDNNLPLLLANGWRVVPDVPAISNGWSRSQVVFVEGDGTNASASYTDYSPAYLAAQDAAAASNAAAQVVATAIAWTNTFTNAWLKPYHVAAAHSFKTLGAKYLPGWPTNTTWTYNSAMAAFLAMPAGSQTLTQLWDNVFWQRSYVNLSDILTVYFPSTNAADPTDYNLKAYPELNLWDMPGIK